MGSAPIILVPGFWLRACAWDEVADALRADGHDVTALNIDLPTSHWPMWSKPKELAGIISHIAKAHRSGAP